MPDSKSTCAPLAGAVTVIVPSALAGVAGIPTSKPTTRVNDKTILNKAIESQENVAKLRKKFEDEISEKQKTLYDCQIEYLSKLNLMFKSDFHLKDDY